MEERSTAFFLHNTPNEVAAAPPVLAVAFSSLLTICLMMEQGRQVHQHFPSEPQREITTLILDRQRGLVLNDLMNLICGW